MTLVETSDEEPTLAVARYIAELAWSEAGEEVAEEQISQYCHEAQRLLAAQRATELVDLLLTSHEAIFSNASEKDIEFVFAVVRNLVSKAGTPDQEMGMANHITGVLTGKPSDKPTLRLKLLFNLYNTLRSPYGKYQTYMRALSFTVAAKSTDLIIPSFKRLDSFLKDWNLGIDDQRALYLAVTNILRDSKSSSKDAFAYLLKYLATFAGGEDQRALADPQVRENAAKAAVDFIKTPDLYQCDLLEMKAVRQLENDPKFGVVFQLLSIFLTGRLDNYLALYSNQGSILKSFGLVHEDCMSKMRLLSLASLASESASREIPYAQIQDTLKIDADDVELWVVKAIAAKLLEARMDQMREVVIVSRCTQRIFGPTQWRELRSSLGVWKESISKVAAQVQQTRASGNVVPRGLQQQSVY
eukprot:TRINITY_DN21784_c0_g1_i1.p1 TRINITY_DN21784_c0_g1~~TRINITY_DN21784_c0_g1_i1.p1  ORF type:complete len:415 (+),score=92.54 TRINITY_DN21784_c0_g1_i1:62-1306(+)